MTGFSFPEGLIACVNAYHDGGYESAREAFLPYLPLVNFEFQAGIALALRKHSLVHRGLIVTPSPFAANRYTTSSTWLVLSMPSEAVGSSRITKGALRKKARASAIRCH